MTRVISRFRCQLSVAAAILLPSLVFGDTETTDSKTISSSKEAPPIEKSWCETPPDWQFRIGLPGWLAGLSGDSEVKGVVSAADVSFDQLLHHLTHFPIALSADVRYKRWELFGFGQYIEVGDHATLPGLLFTNANVHIQNGILQGIPWLSIDQLR